MYPLLKQNSYVFLNEGILLRSKYNTKEAIEVLESVIKNSN